MDELEPTPSASSVPSPRDRAREWRHATRDAVFRGRFDEPPGRKARLRQLAEDLRFGRRAMLVFATNRFRVTYRAQVLGIFWPMANPLILVTVMSVVFGVIFKTDIEAYPVFLMLGMVLWNFVIHSWTDGTACLVRHAQVVKRTAVPSYVVVTGTVLSHLFTLGFSSLSLVPLVAFYPEAFHISAALLLLPVLIAIAIITVLGLVLATSVLNVLYRDVGYVVDSILLVMFWATPIVWPLERLPQSIHGVLLLNPVAANLHCMRDVIMKGVFPPLSVFLSAALGSLVLLLIGTVVHRRIDSLVTDHV